MTKKCQTKEIVLVFLVCFFLLALIYSIPNREQLSLLANSPPLSPLAAKMAIERKHALDDYLQTLGPDIYYSAYYSPYYNKRVNNLIEDENKI